MSLRGVTKVFRRADAAGEVHALGPVDLDLRKGEFFAVVGPSGCGKSSLLEVIAGLSVPTQGQVAFEGRPVGDRVPDGIGWAEGVAFFLLVLMLIVRPTGILGSAERDA